MFIQYKSVEWRGESDEPTNPRFCRDLQRSGGCGVLFCSPARISLLNRGVLTNIIQGLLWQKKKKRSVGFLFFVFILLFLNLLILHQIFSNYLFVSMTKSKK